MTRYLLWGTVLFFLADHSDNTKTELHFDVFLKNKNKVVGSLTTSRTKVGPKTLYHSSTNIQTRLIVDVQVDYDYSVTFVKDHLEEANVEITVNDKPHSKTRTIRNKNQYQITKDNGDQIVLDDVIDYSTILLYFKEPAQIDQCYSEQDGSINHIIDLGDHVYKKINAKNKENLYYYENGVLKKATIDGGIVQLEILANN